MAPMNTKSGTASRSQFSITPAKMRDTPIFRKAMGRPPMNAKIMPMPPSTKATG